MEYKELFIPLLIIIGIMVFVLLYSKLIDLILSVQTWFEIRKNKRVAKELRYSEKRTRAKS